jgi:hypothetical protein
MSEMYVEGDYLRLNPTWNVEHSAWKARLIRDLLDENLVQFKKIIETGCGAGQILVQLSKIFPSKFFVGYDISRQAYELANDFESKNVKFKLGNYLKESETKDEVIICSDVSEHVEDYFSFLKSRRNVGHLHNFNKEIAEATLLTRGYKIIDSRITDGCLEFPDRGMGGRTFWLIRKLCNYMSPSITARVFGGFSFLVLAEGAHVF